MEDFAYKIRLLFWRASGKMEIVILAITVCQVLLQWGGVRIFTGGKVLCTVGIFPLGRVRAPVPRGRALAIQKAPMDFPSVLFLA